MPGIPSSFSGDWVWSTAPKWSLTAPYSSLRDKVLRSGNQSAPLLYRKLVPTLKCTAWGMEEIAKKDQAIYLPPQICSPMSNFKQPVWELLASVTCPGSPTAHHCEQLRTWSCLLCGKCTAQTSLGLSWQSIPWKRKQFCNKSNCATIFVCITSKHLRWLVWPRLSQSICTTPTHVWQYMLQTHL